MHPLDGIRAKIDRGEEHVHALNEAMDALFAGEHSPTFGVRHEFHPEDETFRIVISAVDQIPPKIGTIVGDAVHCFRSALDQLVFELAFIDTGGKEVETTAFPASYIIDNFRDPKGTVQRKFLSGLTQRHRAMFKRFQPYQAPKALRPRHLLTFLDNLSNDDKHRLLQPLLVSAQGFHFKFPGDLKGHNCHIPAAPARVQLNNFIGRPLQPETELMRVHIVITGPNPQMPVECISTSRVGLRDGTPVQDSLEVVLPFVREIVDFFAPEFERPKALRVRDLPRVGRFPFNEAPRPFTVAIASQDATSGTITPIPIAKATQVRH